MKRLLSVAGLFLALIAGCVSFGGGGSSALFEDDFSGDNVAMGKPANWQWWIHAADIWADESEDAPSPYGPGVMTLGNNAARGDVHLALTAKELEGVDDYRVTLLWSDRLVSGEIGDADFPSASAARRRKRASRRPFPTAVTSLKSTAIRRIRPI